MSCQDKVLGTQPIIRRDGLATATGGDVMVRMLQEFREMQEESKEQFARTERALRTVHMKCRVLFRKTQRMSDRIHAISEQVSALDAEMNEFRDNVGELTTHVSTLTQEVHGIKSTQIRMFGQVGRALNHLADAQSSDRERIVTLERTVGGEGEH
ncbi:hypothetical protein D7X55_20550 [Corallococcus sp. AB049A]|uniref:Chemotaxis protein n=1 Tax=Corallococcus interemptor TaxID=2316720 RepID=A0A3A8QK74_9BACT|nr:hypothetical protein D7Y23_11485 [Corallococcus sp. AB050B]RKH69053.1 hypothetical protein D7X96_15855 [Corallococcus interemptor]RKI63259.1 hypothetical protein D7X55_20550 [Corallococcus sp. AB049A]